MKKYIIIMIIALLLLLAGCGQKEEPEPMEEPESIADWKAAGFQLSKDLEINPTLWLGDYLLWEHLPQNPDNKSVCELAHGTYQNTMWFLGTELGEEGIIVSGPRGEYVLETYDTVSGEYGRKSFTPKLLGIEEAAGYLTEMDVVSEDLYMFRWAGYTKDEEELYSQISDIIIFTDLEGNNKFLDVRKVFAEEEIEDYRAEILPLWPSAECHADKNGNIWLIKLGRWGDFQFYLFNQNGEKIIHYEGEENQTLDVRSAFRTQDGEVILPVYNSLQNKYDFLWVDSESNKFVSLATMDAKGPDILQVYGLFGNELYYRTVNPETRIGEGLVKWNILSGEQTWIFEFKIYGLSNYETMMVRNDSKKITLRLLTTGGSVKDWLVPLVEEEPSLEGAICVADFTGRGVQLETGISKASMELPNRRFVYQDVSAEEDRTRMFAELSKGEGADIMYVSMEDFYSLQEKGLLMDMNLLLSREFCSELLPAVLDIGRVDGTLWGIPTGVHAETFAVKDDLCRDTASLEELISLMEEGKLAGAISSPYVMKGYLEPFLTVRMLTKYSVNSSFLIDWENRISHFDDERFIRLLELTGTDRSGESEAGWQDNDLVYGHFNIVYGIADYFVNLEKEGMKSIGYPDHDAVGFIIPEAGVVVVNKNISDKEAVTLYLEELLGEEIQSKVEVENFCLSVRKLEVEDYVKWNEDGNPVFGGGFNAIELPVYEDGTTPVHRAKAFLEECRAVPRSYNQIDKILIEELSAMYRDGKGAAETAEIINTRVQLYLDETK